MSYKLGHVLERKEESMPLNIFIPVNAASLCSFLPKEMACCQHAGVLARCHCITFGGHQEISNFKRWGGMGKEGGQTRHYIYIHIYEPYIETYGHCTILITCKKIYETHFHT